MNVKAYIDTNIIIYLYSESEKQKRKIIGKQKIINPFN